MHTVDAVNFHKNTCFIAFYPIYDKGLDTSMHVIIKLLRQRYKNIFYFYLTILSKKYIDKMKQKY
ncbi:hypothetical protein HMPREF1985_01025 [Mitsuokella sp. oral taxon 131 str. W9106]|nr:hypothetical protein HMPREF1985_01025 [Mitsuokella sp. oral taxon 131 str. W9106]